MLQTVFVRPGLAAGILLVAILSFASLGCNTDPEAAKQRFLERGNEYFANEKYKEASIMYRNALKKDMKYGEAYYHLGMVHKRLGFRLPVRAQDIMQAVNSFRRALEDERLTPESRKATMGELSEIYVWYYTTNPSQQDREFLNNEVGKLRDEFYKLDPNSFDGKRLDGFLALTEGRLDEAITLFQDALTLKPEDSGLQLAIMGIKMRQNKGDEAEQIAKSIIAADPKYAAAYDALYLFYMVNRRADEAAAILEKRNEVLPGNLQNSIKLAQHYKVFGQAEKRDALLRKIVENPQDFTGGREAVIRHLFQFSEWDRAIDIAREGVTKDAARKATYNNYIAEALIKKGDPQAAQQVVETTLSADEDNPIALALKGQMLLETKDPKSAKTALDDLTKAVAAQPDNVVMRYDLGRAYVASGSIDKAMNEFQQAIQRRAAYMPAHLALAKLYLLRREYANAISSADRVIQLTAMRPSADAIIVKAISQMALGELDKAQELLIRGAGIHPQVVEMHFELGRVYLAKKQLPQAEQSFQKALDANPKDFRGMSGMAEVYAQQGRPDYAIQFLTSKLGVAENPVLLRNAIGNLYVRQGELDKALQNYLELAKTVPNSADLNMRIGEVYRRKGELQSSVTYMQRSSELDPNNIVPLMQTAAVLGEMGRNREATDAYERALRLDPENVVALNNLAYMHAETGGDLDLALKYAEMAKRKAPSNTQIDDTLGWIYVKKNLNDNALVILRNIVKQQPKNPTFRYHLGVALAQRGDADQAKQELNQALKDGASAKEAEEIRKVLSRL